VITSDPTMTHKQIDGPPWSVRKDRGQTKKASGAPLNTSHRTLFRYTGGLFYKGIISGEGGTLNPYNLTELLGMAISC